MNSLIHSIPSLQPDTVISILAGSIIAILVSYFTYRKSGDKLIQESKILKQQTQLILIALEQAGFIELKTATPSSQTMFGSINKTKRSATMYCKWPLKPAAIPPTTFST